MSSSFQLSKEQIIAALSALNEKLAAKEVRGELCIFGGAAMVLAFDARQSTRDVDAVFVPKGEVAELVVSVAEEMNLEKDWLNDGVKGFLSAKGDHTSDDMPQFSHLLVLRPTAEYLLALKLMSARSGAFDMAKDREDAVVLCRRLGIRSFDEAVALIERYFPVSSVQPRTQFFVEEIIAQLS
ncbi:MAG: DUF6036 family nucleotidyltransferase [Prosthecobacter sp.]|nr:DUF6036 family nucleotidyltransferase [Prosthecobacter sp.]